MRASREIIVQVVKFWYRKKTFPSKIGDPTQIPAHISPHTTTVDAYTVLILRRRERQGKRVMQLFVKLAF